MAVEGRRDEKRHAVGARTTSGAAAPATRQETSMVEGAESERQARERCATGGASS